MSAVNRGCEFQIFSRHMGEDRAKTTEDQHAIVVKHRDRCMILGDVRRYTLGDELHDATQCELLPPDTSVGGSRN